MSRWLDAQSMAAWHEARSAGQSIVLRLPWPVSTNHLYRAAPAVSKATGRTIAVNRKSPKAKAFTEEVGWWVLRARANVRLTGPVVVLVCAMPPDKRRRDVANIEKVLLDALVKAGVIADDSQVRDTRLVFARSAYSDAPTVAGVEVSIREVTADELPPLF